MSLLIYLDKRNSNDIPKGMPSEVDDLYIDPTSNEKPATQIV